jgi:hypothetical protein
MIIDFRMSGQLDILVEHLTPCSQCPEKLRLLRAKGRATQYYESGPNVLFTQCIFRCNCLCKVGFLY